MIFIIFLGFFCETCSIFIDKGNVNFRQLSIQSLIFGLTVAKKLIKKNYTSYNIFILL